MGRLIKAEFIKLSKSLGYKILVLCMFGIGILFGFLMMDTQVGEPNGYSAYLSSLADSQIFITIFAAIFVCSEFSNRTFGMSLFSGCPRWRILVSKAIVFLIGLIPIVFSGPLISCLMVSISKGFGLWTWPELLLPTFLFILGNMAGGTFCFMLSIFIKNIGGTIGAGLGVVLGVQLLGMFPKAEPLLKLTFLYQMNLLPHPESTALFIAISVLTLAIALCAAVLIFQKAELK